MVAVGTRRSNDFARLFTIGALAALLALPAAAQKVKEGKDSLDDLVLVRNQSWLTLQADDVRALPEQAAPLIRQDLNSLQAASGNRWILMLDKITGKPSLVEGGIPWIPGTGLGNAVRAQDLTVTEEQASRNEIPVKVVAAKAVEFMKTYPSILSVDPSELVLMEKASGPVLDYLYNVNFEWEYKGIPVEDAQVTFCLNSGNLVMFGAQNICDTIRGLDPKPSIASDVAWEILWGYLGSTSPQDEIVESGKLLIQPETQKAVINGLSYEAGHGLGYRLVYVLSFRRSGVMGTWEGRVDAHTGEVVAFQDVNAYGHIQGGVYKTDKNPTQDEVVMPFPYADYGTSSFADAAGNFTGTTGTGTMTGRTGSIGNVGGVDIVDTTCGTISLLADANGLIDFGTSAGTDCPPPGQGGLGNSHAARTQYWNVSQIKIKAYTYLPTNTWLQGRLTDNVNLNQTCNAFWNGSSLNFFMSGGGCNNTGELPGVSLHEFGHGMDSNDGNGSSPDGGTGEIYGDTTAMLQTHQSCLGGGFQGSNCAGYGWPCTNCTGVREADYNLHSPATMATPTNFNQVRCPSYTGPKTTCKGPCGYECHCEDAPGIQANWDLAVRVLTSAPYNLDAASAWQLLDKFWYASAPNRTAAFACGNNTSTAVGNLFNQYRVVDDCDGNLANGTPHAAAIWTAMSNHGIGNSAAVSTDNNCGCTTLAAPALSGTPGNGSASLSWGAVTGAASYDVYRNETGCTAGYTKIGNTAALTFTDSPLANGVTYYYVIQTKGTGTCPPSAMSNCLTLTPTTCTPPNAPNITSATAGCSGVALAWSSGSGATSYNVYRGTASGGPYSKLGGMPVTGTTYTDTSVSAGNTYYYVVRGACDAGGTVESANSNERSATATGTPSAPTGISVTGSCTGVSVSWSASSGATSYDVVRGTVCGTPVTTFAGVTSPYNDTTAVAGTTYQYWVVAKNSCGTSANSSCASGTRTAVRAAPGTPTFSSVSCTSLILNWTAVTGATGYDVYRAAGATCSGATKLGNTTATNYPDSGLSGGTHYSYYIVAKNACGDSATGSCGTTTTAVCTPNIVYSANGSWVQVASMGNSGSVLDPGESWDVVVTLANAGTAAATNVVASLTVTGATFCSGTASFGTIPAGNSATATFRFTIDQAFTCGNNLSFNVVNKSSSEGFYANENGAFTKQVGTAGSGTPQTSTIANFTLPVNATTPKSLAPDCTVAGGSAASASVTYTVTANLNKLSSSLLRHVASGNTTPLAKPTGTLPATSIVGVTSFYNTNGPGTYQMEWTTSNGSAVTLTNISMTVTPSTSPVCNTWTGANCIPSIPPETAPGTSLSTAQTWTDKNTQTWPPASGAQTYKVYYGLLADLPGLTSTAVDSCQHSLASPANTSDATFTEDPTGKAGGFYWYLITATNASGEGTAGPYNTTGTPTSRIVNLKSSGCPP